MYMSHIQAFALQTKQIVEHLEANGHNFEIVFLCGGLQNNEVYVQAHADVLQRPVVVPNCQETVALGSAILAAAGFGATFESIQKAMTIFGGEGKVYEPRRELFRFYDWKYSILKDMCTLALKASS